MINNNSNNNNNHQDRSDLWRRTLDVATQPRAQHFQVALSEPSISSRNSPSPHCRVIELEVGLVVTFFLAGTRYQELSTSCQRSK